MALQRHLKNTEKKFCISLINLCPTEINLEKLKIEIFLMNMKVKLYVNIFNILSTVYSFLQFYLIYTIH